MSQAFGDYLRAVRERKAADDPAFSLRQVAGAVDIEPSYLSKIERGIEAPPGEGTIKDLAKVLAEDPDVLLALAGRVSSDLQAIICKRPALFAELLRTFRSLPNHAVARVVREVRDGDW
ncbi:MAG: helix-turn-helix transcriptional regulator [Opitutaceae bacterium]|nr:helix-turn-helix transcriptional regulator [Opitutaceae bacterium]